MKNPSSDYLVNTKNKINNANITIAVKGIKKNAFPSLVREQKGIRTYSTYAVAFSSRNMPNVRHFSSRPIKTTEINPSIRKVLSVSNDTKMMIPAVKKNNLSIIRSGKKEILFSRAPNKHGINKLDPNLKKLRNSVERIKKILKKSKSNILYPFSSFFYSKNIKNYKKSIKLASNHFLFSLKKVGGQSQNTNPTLYHNNHHIILTDVKKDTKSPKSTVLGKLPFNNKVPGKFKKANKGVRLFTPISYTIHKIRY
jgi:hypothetical protein